MGANPQRWSPILIFTGAAMLTQEQAQRLAHEWIEASNSHDLDKILAHYDEDVVLVSPDLWFEC
jgi:ketosteroid isomerase-like protein